MQRTFRLALLMLFGALVGSAALGLPILDIFSARMLLQKGDPGVLQIGAIAGAFFGLLAEAAFRLNESRFRFGLRDWILFAMLATVAFGIMSAVTRYIHTRS